MPVKQQTFAQDGAPRQFHIRADDVAPHATNIKGMSVWEGERNSSFRWRINYELTVGPNQTWEVLKDGVSQGTLTLGANSRRSTLSTGTILLNEGNLLTIRHTAGDATGLRAVISFTEAP